MSMFRAIDISATGLQAGRTRMDAIAHNIANVENVGENGRPFRRKEVILVAQEGGPGGGRALGGVRVAGIREDPGPPVLVYRPEDPAADAQGYVHLSNVNLPLEMVDLVTASRAYEANAAALKTTREMNRRTLEIMR